MIPGLVLLPPQTGQQFLPHPAGRGGHSKAEHQGQEPGREHHAFPMHPHGIESKTLFKKSLASFPQIDRLSQDFEVAVTA